MNPRSLSCLLLLAVLIAALGGVVWSRGEARVCEEAGGAWEPLAWTCRKPRPVILRRDLERV